MLCQSSKNVGAASIIYKGPWKEVLKELGICSVRDKSHRIILKSRVSRSFSRWRDQGSGKESILFQINEPWSQTTMGSSYLQRHLCFLCPAWTHKREIKEKIPQVYV